MIQVTAQCPVCGHSLLDGGNLQDFFGPYSPYEEMNSYGDLAQANEEGQCVHLIYCPQCGYDHREAIAQVEV
jgi:rubrerythrin